MTQRLFDLLSEEAVKLFIVPVTMAAIGLLLVTKNYLRHTTPSSVRVAEAVQSNEVADKVPEEPKPPMSDDSVKKIMEAQTQAQVAKLEADEAKAEAAEQVRKARSELRDAVKAQAAAELTAKRLYKLVGSSEVNTASPPDRSSRSLWKSDNSKRSVQQGKSFTNLEEASTDTEFSKQELAFELGPEYSS